MTQREKDLNRGKLLGATSPASYANGCAYARKEVAARLYQLVRDAEAAEENCGMDAGKLYPILDALCGELRDLACDLELEALP